MAKVGCRTKKKLMNVVGETSDKRQTMQDERERRGRKWELEEKQGK